MSCREIKSVIAIEPAGFLEDAERAALEDHLKTCEECSMKTERFHAALDSIKEEATVPVGMFERVLAEAKGSAPLAPLFNEDEEAAPGKAIVLALSCAYCHGPLSRGEACYCASCLTPHHDDCFRTYGRCTAMGCDEVAIVRPRGLEQRSTRARRSRIGVWGAGLGLVLTLGAGAAALIDDRLNPFAEAPPAQIGILSGPAQASLGTGAVGVAPSPQSIDLEVVDKDLREVMEDIGRRIRRNILVAPGVEEKVTIKLRDIPAMDAVRIIAELCRCRIEQAAEGVLLLTQPPKVTIQFTDAQLRTVVQLLAAYSGKNIVIAPGVEGRACLDLKDVYWDLALEAIAEAYQIQIREREGVIVLTDKGSDWGERLNERPEEDGFRLDSIIKFVGKGDFEELSKQLQRSTGLKIVAEDVPEGEFQLECDGSLRSIVRLLAASFDCEAIFTEGAVRVRPVAANTFRARRVDARLWFAALSRLMGTNLILPRTSRRLDFQGQNLAVNAVMVETSERLGMRLKETGGIATILPSSPEVNDEVAPAPAQEFGYKRGGRELTFQLRLDAVLGRFTGKRPEVLAIMNDVILKVGDRVLGLDGDEIDTFAVTSIERDGVFIANTSGTFFRVPFNP